MFKFFKKHWLLIGLAMVASLLGAIWFIGQSKPTEELPNLPKIEASVLSGRNIEPATRATLNIALPGNIAPVAKLIRKHPFDAQKIRELAANFGFNSEPIVSQDIEKGSIYIYNSADYSLTITPATNAILYAKNLSQEISPEGTLPSQEVAAAKSAAFATSVGLSIDQYTTKSFYLSSNGPEIQQVSEADADLIEVHLIKQFGGLSIVAQNIDFYTLRTWINKNGEIVRFEWRDEIESLTAGQEYPLKNIDELSTTIYIEGKIVLVENKSEVGFTPNIGQINITQSSVAYFLPSSGDILQPVFVLNGTVTSGNINYPVWIYVPAIKSIYFTQ